MQINTNVTENGEQIQALLVQIRSVLPEVQSVLIHPAGIQLHEQPDTYALQGEVKACLFRGATYHIAVCVDSVHELVFEITSFASPIPEVGENLNIYIIKDAIVPLLQN